MTKQNPVRKRRKPRVLARSDWIEAGFATLGREGPGGVRVERLARALGATKGSFYWHFRDRAELEAAILDAWDKRTTAAILGQAAGAEPADDRLRRLGQLVTDAAEPGQLFEIERAVRSWGVFEPRVATRVAAVDRRRLGALGALFRECGFGRADAELRARIFVYYVAGEAVSEARPPLAARRRLAQQRVELLLKR